MIKSEEGKVLLIAIFLIVLISILGLGLFSVTANSNKTTVNERADQSLYYVAESGISLEKAKIKETIQSLHGKVIANLNNQLQSKTITKVQSADVYMQLMKQNFCSEYLNSTDHVNCTTTATHSKVENVYEFYQKQFNQQPFSKSITQFSCEKVTEIICSAEIKSQGLYKGTTIKTRQLEQVVKIIFNPNTGGISTTSPSNPASPGLPPYLQAAVFTPGTLSVSGNAHDLYGNIFAAKATNTDLNFNSGSLTVDSNYAKVDLNQYMPKVPTKQSNGTYSVNGQTIKLSGNVEVNCTNLHSYLCGNSKDDKNKLTIDVGSGDVNLFIDQLNIPKLTLNVIGSGKLNIIVKTKLVMEDSFIRSSNPSNVTVFYMGSEELKWSGNKDRVIEGSLYIDKASLKISGNTDVEIIGNLYYNSSNELEFAGNADGKGGRAIIAPNATVKNSGNLDYYGTILAKNMNISGNVDLHYTTPTVLIPQPPTLETIELFDPNNAEFKESSIKEK